MEQQLKQRLVGAVVLVSLAVIFIPIILEGPGDEWSARNQNIPQPPPLDFRGSAELPLPDAMDDSDDGAPVAALPLPVEAPPEPEPGVASPPDTVAAPEVPEPSAAAPVPVKAPGTTPREATVAAAPADGWYAQVGSFSQQANADGLRARLTQAGFAAHLQRTATGKGSSYRVLVGPTRERAAAEQLLQKLVREQKLKGIVIELPAAPG